MGANSKIEWTHHTFNPWIGCAKVSPGCKNCYAETMMDHRYGRVQWGVNGTRARTGDANWKKPLQWDKQAAATGERHRVFCASLADVFEDREDLVQWRTELFLLIDATPNLDWLLLTKRPENIERMWRELNGRGWLDDRRTNVWLGTSVENQETADIRIPDLLMAAHLARFTFLSMEPLLGPVDLNAMWVTCKRCNGTMSIPVESGGDPCPECLKPYQGVRPAINWVIVGGESGPGARPMHPAWVRDIRAQCDAAGVPFLFKQWGEYRPPAIGTEDHAGEPIKMGKHAAGRMLDGVEHNGLPS